MTAEISPARAALQAAATRLEKRRQRTRNAQKIEALTEALRDIRALDAEEVRLEALTARLQPAEEATEARQSLPVACEVVLPLGSVTEALTVLQEVPIDATLALRTSGPVPMRGGGYGPDELALLDPRVVIRWTEAR